MKRFYERSMNRQTLKTNPMEHLSDLLELSFDGPAARWLQLIKDDLKDWEQFSREFINKYWSRDVQRNVKSKIEAERYRPNGSLSRTEYFTERTLLLQSILPPMSEDEIVTLLAERFDSIIQDSLCVQNVTTIKDFEKLLQREDIREDHRRTRNHPNELRPNNAQVNQQNYNNRRGFAPRSPPHSPRTDNRAYHPRGGGPPHNDHRRHPYQRNEPRYESQNYQRPGPSYRNQNPHDSQPPDNRHTRTSHPIQTISYHRRHNHPPYPTPEQTQLCTFMKEQSRNPTPNQQNSVNNPDPHMITRAPENDRAL